MEVNVEQIIWTEDFSVGVARIDEQHKRLIGMINRLISAPQARARSETISDLLNDMTSYAQEHFATEEALMRQYNYPQLEEHVAQHRTFREKTVGFCSAAILDAPGLPEAMLYYLRNWLVDHILNSDMAFKPFFREQGLK